MIEDVVTDDARASALKRATPTLIVQLSSASGLTRATVSRLEAWAEELRAG